MSQTIAVTVKSFSVTECLDPKSKTEIPAKFKPKAISALKSVQVDPPRGKTLTPYSVSFNVTIKKHPKGVKSEARFAFFDQDIYSKREKLLGEGASAATVQTATPDKDDTEAAVQAALDAALDTLKGGIKDTAK